MSNTTTPLFSRKFYSRTQAYWRRLPHIYPQITTPPRNEKHPNIQTYLNPQGWVNVPYNLLYIAIPHDEDVSANGHPRVGSKRLPGVVQRAHHNRALNNGCCRIYTIATRSRVVPRRLAVALNFRFGLAGAAGPARRGQPRARPDDLASGTVVSPTPDHT
eukprot:761561-Hanusia_phi.AAC.1